MTDSIYPVTALYITAVLKRLWKKRKKQKVRFTDDIFCYMYSLYFANIENENHSETLPGHYMPPPLFIFITRIRNLFYYKSDNQLINTYNRIADEI